MDRQPMLSSVQEFDTGIYLPSVISKYKVEKLIDIFFMSVTVSTISTTECHYHHHHHCSCGTFFTLLNNHVIIPSKGFMPLHS
jgi:hypothetical protein